MGTLYTDAFCISYLYLISDRLETRTKIASSDRAVVGETTALD